MRFHKQNSSKENKQYISMDFFNSNSNVNEIKQHFIVNTGGMNRNVSLLMAKRESFRSSIRKEYLKAYFEKKRVQFFGWKSHQSATFFHNQDSYEVQIDNSPNFISVSHCNSATDVQPAYDSNYFKDVILLQKFISEDQLCPESNDQVNFRYKSFYSFLISIIQQNLDQTYFHHQFTNQNIFQNHFTVLKNVLYKKLAQQMSDFLLQVQQFIISQQKQNTWGYHQILLETYEKLIYQIASFLKGENLEFRKETNRPVISIEEQMTVLLKMLIEVTYYDEIQCEEGQNYRQQNVSYQRAYQKLSNILSTQQQDDPTSINTSTQLNMTRIMIDCTDIISTLKFFIVFGQLHESSNQSCNNYRQEDEIKGRQRIICLMMMLLRNVAINIGSDLLFEEGVIAELNCLLNERLFKVEIRRNSNSNNKTKLPFSQSSNNMYSPFHYCIKQFLIGSFQMIRMDQTQSYLSQMDSFQFVFDVLQHIVSVKRQQQRVGNQQQSHQRVVIGGEYEMFEVDDDNLSGNNDDDDQKEFHQATKHKTLNTLIRLAQNCIQCLKFHFYLGEIKLNSHYTLPQTNVFSSRNRYVVKFNYIPNSQQVLMRFQSGQQLFKLING